jgi:hypothetical protein
MSGTYRVLYTFERDLAMRNAGLIVANRVIVFAPTRAYDGALMDLPPPGRILEGNTEQCVGMPVGNDLT